MNMDCDSNMAGIDMPEHDNSISFVPINNLCTGCGTCNGICPQGCIDMCFDHSSGLIKPAVDASTCVQCGLCLKVCPGWKLNIDSLRPKDQCGVTVPTLGKISTAFMGCSCKDAIRISSASGGMISEVLFYLMEQGLIEGAIVTRMSSQHPLETETFIARNPEEILAAQKSKYCPVAACSILKEVLANEQRYVFVGLPCHVAGLRKAQLQFPEVAKRVHYILGLFCSRSPNANATRHLLYSLGINLPDVQSIDYRGEGHPGRMIIRLKNGSQKHVDHLNYQYWGYSFLKYFKPIRCWLCPDHSAELADISFGDNWANVYPFKRDKKGSSIVVARSLRAADLLRNMVDLRRIVIHQIPADTIVRSQGMVNKTNVLPRLWIWHKTGHVIPDLVRRHRSQFNTKDILAAIPEFVRVLLSMRYHHPMLMKAVIRISWIVEQVVGLIWRTARRVRRIPRLVISGVKTLLFIKGHMLKRSSKHKVVMIGGFGGHDIGDEAMPHADILNLRANINHLEIVMCSPDPEYTSKFHHERSINDVTGLSWRRNANLRAKLLPAVRTLLFLFGALAERIGLHMRLWPTARSLLDEIASADLLFNVGGGNLTSIIPSELYKKCTTYLAAKILRKSVILSGQTIGPFTRSMDAFYARFCLNSVHTITFRDKDISHQRLRAIGVSKPVMLDAADDAMTIPSISREEAEDLLRSCASAPWLDRQVPLTVGMNLKGSLRLFKGENRNSGLDLEIDLMAKIADSLVRVYGAKIFFLPTDYCPGVDDREVHRDIISRMKCAPSALCIEEEFDDATLKGIIAIADVAIGARYHFAVFAASNLLPFLGIASGVYQQTKLNGLADLCGLPQCFVPDDMEFATFDQVWPKVQKIIDERELIANQLTRQIPILKRRSLMGVETAIKIMCSR